MWGFLLKTDTGPSERAYIELEGVEVIVKTASKAKFSLEFHSYCLEGALTLFLISVQT